MSLTPSIHSHSPHSPILLSLSGQDQPGITAMVMKLAAQYKLMVLDLGQAVIHGHLHLGLVFQQTTDHHHFFMDVLFQAKQLNLTVHFSPLNAEALTQTPPQEWVITSVSTNPFESNFLQAITELLAKHHLNIKNIHYSQNRDLPCWVLELQTESNGAMDLKHQLYQLAQRYQIDLSINLHDLFRYNKRLVVFDMDSTLIEQEVIDELAKIKGVGEQVSKITEATMRGELNFSQALKQRVLLLKGLRQEVIEDVKKSITFTKGTKECLQVLKKLGIKTAIISGGFREFASFVAKELEIDNFFANQLEWKDGVLTGEVIGPIIDGEGKAQLLDVLTQTYQIHVKQTVAVGDGSNDLLMLQKAGMGIAFQGKEILRQKTKAQINFGPMLGILPMMGIPLKLETTKE